MKVLLFVTSLFFLIYHPFKNEDYETQQLTPIIETDKGPIQGETLETVVNHHKYYSFRGIPYATPPIGKLRFKPPVEAKAWKNVMKTIREGPNCIQMDVFSGRVNGSEDCLSLNVYAPVITNSSDLRAVMFWIHGGYFKTLSGNGDFHGPDFMIENDVLVVTINYRLGALGFLAFDEHVQGNNAMKDQVLALHWVRKNIARFGGDPERVTIFGLSSGSVCVDLHILSDLSKNLFQRSISMSGSIFSPWAFYSPEDAKKQAFELGALLNDNKSLNNSDDLLQVLEEASASDIVSKTELLFPIRPFKHTLEDPNIAQSEDKFLTRNYYEKFLSGNYSKVPHMLGFTADEALSYIHDVEMFKKRQLQALDYINNDPSVSSFILENIKNKTSADNYVSKEALKKLVDVMSSLMYSTGIDLKQKIMSETGTQPIYYYRYTFDAKENSLHQLDWNITVLNGSAHADDMIVLWHPNVYNLPLEPKHPFSIVRRKLTKLFTNFAKYGNPTPEGENDPLLEVSWPVSGTTGAHLEIDIELKAKKNRPIDSQTEHFQEIVSSRLLSKVPLVIRDDGTLENNKVYEDQ